MPIANLRNPDMTAMLATDFLQHQDHFVGVKNLDTIARNGPAIVDGWIMSNIGKEVAGATAHVNVRGSTEIAEWTSTVNACAALTNPGQNIYRHGLIGMNRLGETNQLALFVEPSVHNSRTYAEGWSATQGLWVMVGIYIPGTATPPNAGAAVKYIMAKGRWDSNPVNYLWSWGIYWQFRAPNTMIAVQLSNTGTGSVTFDGNPNIITVGTYAIVGFIYNPGVNVTVFQNTNYRTAAVPDSIFNGHPNVVPASLNIAATIPITIARHQTFTAGYSSAPGADSYYHFALYGHAAITINQWLSMYHLIKPALGYNTNLGGV